MEWNAYAKDDAVRVACAVTHGTYGNPHGFEVEASAAQARELAAQLIAAADEAESVPRFSEEDIAGVLDAFAEMNTVRKVLDHGSLGKEWFDGFRDELRALRKPREP